MTPPACWLAVHLPALPIECWAATVGAEQAHRPLALLDKAVVCAVDANAWQAGVRPGQRRATALALEPTLLLGRADARREQEALRSVALAALQFTPSAAEQPPHTVLLELAASLRLFGGLGHLIERLAQTLAPLHHQIRWACAPTAGGAALLARWAGWAGHGRGDLAPGAAQGPVLRALSLQDLRTALAEVPLACFCETETERQTLQGMGLHRLGDLKALPREGLARRTGTRLLRRLDQAWGDAPDPQRWVTSPPTFEARLELWTRADAADQVLHAAQFLLTRLVHWVQARQARVARFTLEMAHEPRHRSGHELPRRSAVSVGLAQPSADAAHLNALLRERLAQFVLPAPTLELHLRCDELAHQPPPEGELFPTRARAREGLAQLVEHLQARLGAQRVHGLPFWADHRPERSAGVPAWAPDASEACVSPHPVAQAAASEPAAPLASPHLTRPAWLLPEPRPLHELQGRPLLDGQPLRLLVGPERIETGWWDGLAAARDYFVAATPQGVLVWIFRARLPDPEPAQGWALHGWFA